MVKRISLVWKRPEVSDSEFRRRWLGEHVAYAKQLPGLREYVIDFVTEGPPDAPAGIATVLFDSREALEAAFAIPDLKANLLRTRERFAARVALMFVDVHTVVSTTHEAVK